uniref:remorin-like n=1 Tax=Erigeron canadensis TaxID=72917 RepID=UPI001CB928F9|nr:remorin-like [Erigeron canadensis]
MGEEKEETKNEVPLETELKSTHISTPPPEPKSSSVATPPSEKAPPPPVSDDAALDMIVTEKKLALIKAWEENEKTKADNKAYTKMSAIEAWENTKRAEIEADLRKIEEDIEIEKGKQREKTKNKMAAIHKEAEEKRAVVIAKRGQDIIKAEEAAAKFQATGTLPTKLFKCFGY